MDQKNPTSKAVMANSAQSADDWLLGGKDMDSTELFAEFVQHYRHPVFGFLGRLGFSQADAEDVAQDVFLKAWHYRASYKPRKARPSTWLFTIARNTALNKLAEKRVDQIPIEQFDIAADPHDQPEQQLHAEQSRLALSTALSRLTLDDRCAIALFYIDELSGEQAASVMRCSTVAFKTRLSRARVKLRTVLKDMGEFNER